MKRYCKFCGKELAIGKRSHAIFCNIKCKKSEEHKRRSSDPEKREGNRKRAALWRKENLLQARAKVSAWQKVNVAKTREIGRRYSLTKLKACPPWLSKSQKALMENFYWLSRDLYLTTGQLYHVDHIVPLQGKDVCGLHVPWNLQVLPSDLNIAKKNKVGV